jgi:gas vesicle protein
MNWAEFLDKLLSANYPLATVVLLLVTIGAFFFIFRKPLIKYLFQDKLGMATKNDVSEIGKNVDGVKTELKSDVADVKAELKSDVANVKTELKSDVADVKAELKSDVANLETKLKENDFLHTNKAMLIGFSGLLQNEPQRFERMKDTILETTPDNKKEEIKSITL